MCDIVGLDMGPNQQTAFFCGCCLMIFCMFHTVQYCTVCLPSMVAVC